MNQDVKAKWLAALRSGNYTQGVGALHSADDGYCCLGVLCEVAVQNGVIPEPVIAYNGDYKYGKTEDYLGNALTLPPQVELWAELDSDNPWVEWERDGIQDDGPISNPNDDGLTFDQIADIIENQL